MLTTVAVSSGLGVDSVATNTRRASWALSQTSEALSSPNKVVRCGPSSTGCVEDSRRTLWAASESNEYHTVTQHPTSRHTELNTTTTLLPQVTRFRQQTYERLPRPTAATLEARYGTDVNQTSPAPIATTSFHRRSSLLPPPTPRRAPIPLPSLTSGIIPTLSGVLSLQGLVNFDLAHDNITANPRRGPARMEEWWYSPATSPSMSSMTIRIPKLGLYTVVHSSSPDGRVSVGDVVARLHEQMRAVVNEEQYYCAMSCIDMSVKASGMRSPCWPPYYDEITWLMLLGRRHRWAGLVQSATDGDVWDLILE